MAVLYDKTGAPQEVPEENYHDLVASGRLFVPQGSVVPVVKPDGSLDTVPSEQVYDALGSGATLLGPQSYAQKVAEERYGSPLEQAKTVGEGLLSGATAGISEPVEKTLGVSQEDIEGRRLANPGEAIGSRVVGAVAPALLGEEASPLAALGKAAEEGVGGGLIGALARGATETGVYGASLEASRQAFTGEPADV